MSTTPSSTPWVHGRGYDSLLKTRRQSYKARSRACSKNTLPRPETPTGAARAPFTQADLAEQASAYWLSAGRASFGRSHVTEAVRQLRFGSIRSKPARGRNAGRRELDTQLFSATLSFKARASRPPIGCRVASCL